MSILTLSECPYLSLHRVSGRELALRGNRQKLHTLSAHVSKPDVRQDPGSPAWEFCFPLLSCFSQRETLIISGFRQTFIQPVSVKFKVPLSWHVYVPAISCAMLRSHISLFFFFLTNLRSSCCRLSFIAQIAQWMLSFRTLFTCKVAFYTFWGKICNLL